MARIIGQSLCLSFSGDALTGAGQHATAGNDDSVNMAAIVSIASGDYAMAKSKTPLADMADDAAIAFTCALDDLCSWATAGPEGFTKDEQRRLRDYERKLAKLNKLAKRLRYLAA
jgi:hypothetical protein